jgi:4-hydroxy-3-polyprenylbenzoate decarboxylase
VFVNCSDNQYMPFTTKKRMLNECLFSAHQISDIDRSCNIFYHLPLLQVCKNSGPWRGSCPFSSVLLPHDDIGGVDHAGYVQYGRWRGSTLKMDPYAAGRNDRRRWMKKRIVIGISGASGVIYGVRCLELLRDSGYETHLIISEAGKLTIAIETDYTAKEVAAMADDVYDPQDMAAPFSSGSFLTEGMVVIPCTIKTLSGIANSYSDNLLIRAADVTLKEKRKLVLVVRESPLHKGHLRLMTQAADMGALILPPVPAFYHRPKSVDEIIDQTIGKIFDGFGIQHRLFRRWTGQGRGGRAMPGQR